MPTVYAVFKQGVYRHECAGIFSAEHLARTAADQYLAAGDGYHCWEVVPFEVDVVLPPDPETGTDTPAEPAATYKIEKRRVFVGGKWVRS